MACCRYSHARNTGNWVVGTGSSVISPAVGRRPSFRRYDVACSPTRHRLVVNWQHLAIGTRQLGLLKSPLSPIYRGVLVDRPQSVELRFVGTRGRCRSTELKESLGCVSPWPSCGSPIVPNVIIGTKARSREANVVATEAHHYGPKIRYRS